MKFELELSDGTTVDVFGGTKGATLEVDGKVVLTLPRRGDLTQLLAALANCHQAILRETRRFRSGVQA